GVYTLGPSGLQFSGINNAGTIVGTYNPGNQAFVDIGGVFTAFSDPSATGYTSADGINNAGVIVGFYTIGANQHGYVDNAGLFTTLNDPLATGGTVALGINDAGVIAGTFQGPGGNEGFIATPAPEPAAWALILAGFACLGAALRSRRSRRAALTPRLTNAISST
ncbi:MAG TPA: PEPxxWA-CTERM sorting domain-containing protein, partial [Caulobacteraceae bacterium]